MQKRGQITTFIIIGIVVLAIVATVFYIRQQETERLPREAVPKEAQPIQLFVEECIQKTAVPGIYHLGMQGGHITVPEHAFSTEIYSIGYGFKNKASTLPSIDKMQEQLSEYLKNALPLCINGFEIFRKQGILIEEGELSVETRIFKDDVMFLVSYPLKVVRDEREIMMQNFLAKIPVRLGHNHAVARQIIEKSQKRFVLNELLIPDMKINLLPSSRDTLVIAMLDEKTVIGNRTFLFMFAYELDENRKPSFEIIHNPVFETGKEISFKITATDPDGDALRYSSNSALFSPNPDTGEIITTAPAPGIYDVSFFADDGKGGIAEKSVIFRIVEGEKDA